MPEIPVNLIKGDKIGTETDYRDYLPVNMSGIVKEMFGANGYMLQQPGLSDFGTGAGIDRGGLWNERQQEHYRVSGNSFIRVDGDGNSTTISSFITGSDTVSLPYSFETQGIVANGRFWLYSPTSGFNEVTDVNLGDPLDCVWIDGYYFFTDGENIYHTDINNETVIDPLKFATSEFSPDPTLAVGKTVDNKAIAFNRYSTEYFANRASENFAFTRIPSRAVKAGVVGTHCKVEMMNQWFILGGRKEEDVSVYILGVGDTFKIASREVDKVINQYNEGSLSSSVLEARVEDNVHYLIVHLPNETLIYNHEIAQAAGKDQAWSILKSDVDGDTQWRAKHGVFEPRRGKWVYGDKQGSRLGILDETVSTHYGELAEWLLYTPFIYLDSLSIDELEIETIPGHTTEDDATVFISLTYDGVTHGKEWTQAYGAPSEFGKRFIVRRLGYVRDWVAVKLRGASRSRMAFSRALMDVG